MMQSAVPLACFLSMIRPPGVQFENALLQIAPVDKLKCPFVRDKNDIGFQLYTKHNPTVYQALAMEDDESLFASNMDFHAPTVIYFHAFMEQPDDGSAVMVREAYMLRGETNVIMVDAHHLEAGPWYFTAAENTWYIGRYAAQFIDYLVSRGLDLKKTHLVGHSLGAQSAGVAGAAIKSGRVSRITGLDPALPLFSASKLPVEQRLDVSDADFVDIIHTDAGIFGVNEPIGHVDFYPNGGISPQPGCELEVVIPQHLLLNKFFCSHWRSYQYYAESVIKPSSFLASSCASWRHYTKGGCARERTTHMGFGVDINSKPHGHYTFHLQPNKKTNQLQSKLSKFITYLQTIKKKHKSMKENATHKTLPQPQLDNLDQTIKNLKSHVVKRQRRFIPFLKRSEAAESDNFLFKMLEFLLKNRKSVVPVFTVMREINTLVKSANGELNHSSKERNNYIGAPPPLHAPITYNLELANENKAVVFVKKLLGLTPKGDRLTIGAKK